MAKISRKGDANQVGGQILRGSTDVFANNKPVGLHSSDISPHQGGAKHKKAKTTDGSNTVFVNNMPVLKVGSGNDCGHSIVQGSDDVYVD
jgi:uncharacterized Zn-binding protein involved in type VI secretion